MRVTTKRYRRKPLDVDAVRVNNNNFEDVRNWCQGREDTDDEGKRYIKVRVHNPLKPRQTRAYPGDWILYTDKGYKVYTHPAFRAAFDLYEEPNLNSEGYPISEKEMQELEAVTGVTVRQTTVVEDQPEAVQTHHVTVADGVAVEDTPSSPPVSPSDTAGKRILSVEEQQQMGPDAVRELLAEGDVILAQDLVQSN